VSATKLDPILLPDRTDDFPPCSVVLGDQAFDVQCNGHAMIARAVPVASHAAPEQKRRRDGYLKWCARPTPNPVRVALAELLNILGEPNVPVKEECDDCFGSGFHSNRDGDCTCANCRCDRCDGAGKWLSMPPVRQVFLAGVLLNANLVAIALAALGPDDAADVEIWPNIGEMCVQVQGEGWRVAVMGMNSLMSDTTNTPRHFMPEAP
jgi:hypothetical protein